MKPKCKLVGEDGNIFSIMSKASRVLKQNDMKKEADEMCNKIMSCGSYDDALRIVMEYVDVE